MPLTLAVIAGLLLLLPGLTGIAAWSLSTKSSVSRPELPLTAVSVLLVALIVSLCVHLLGDLLANALWSIGPAIGAELPPPGPSHPLLTSIFYRNGRLPASLPNPYDQMRLLATGGDLSTGGLVEVAATIICECAVVAAFILNDGLSVALDGIDLSNRGWVFEHVIRPGQNGYRPIAYVLTSMMKDGLGIGYKGLIGDFRLSERGEILTLSLNRPERFLYELRAGTASAYGADANAPEFVRHTEDYIGGVVVIDGKAISNIAISNPRADLVGRIGAQVDALGGTLPSETLAP